MIFVDELTKLIFMPKNKQLLNEILSIGIIEDYELSCAR